MEASPGIYFFCKLSDSHVWVFVSVWVNVCFDVSRVGWGQGVDGVGLDNGQVFSVGPGEVGVQSAVVQAVTAVFLAREAALLGPAGLVATSDVHPHGRGQGHDQHHRHDHADGDFNLEDDDM